MRNAIQKNAKVLALFAIVCTTIVGLVHLLTKDKIEQQKQLQLLNRLSQVIAPSLYNNEIINDCIIVPKIKSEELITTALLTKEKIGTPIEDSSLEIATNEQPIKINKQNALKAYIATYNDKPVAMAITTVAPDGYNGNIELLVGINTNGVVSGVRVLEHKETPGLGDKIEISRHPWITSFKNTELNGIPDPRWNVAKDGGMFDQFTGATITPRAVVKAVYNTVVYFNKNKQQLFKLPRNCGELK